MIIISHRGNLNGPEAATENMPAQLTTALEAGFHVECDVWYTGGHFWLGHDVATWTADEFVRNAHPFKVWFHAKNVEALVELSALNKHYFAHDKDPYTVTSREFFWCYPGCRVPRTWGVQVHRPGDVVQAHAEAICTDSPFRLRG